MKTQRRYSDKQEENLINNIGFKYFLNKHRDNLASVINNKRQALKNYNNLVLDK